MENIKTNIILFKLDEFPEFVSASKAYEEKEDIEITQAQSALDIGKSLKSLPHGILLFSVKSRADFQALISVFKHYSKAIKSGKLKLCLVQAKKNIKIETILRKFGCNEFLDSAIKQKPLKYKLDFWSKTIIKTLERESKKGMGYGQGNESSSAKGGADEGIKRPKFEVIDPLKERVDIWISPKGNCRKVLTKWLVSLQGPSSNVAQWESAGPDLWKFVINEENKKRFYQSEGNWFFTGVKPEFNWRDKVWTFTSANPKLYFEGDHECTLFYKEEETLYICETSRYAKSLLQQILDSADSKFNIERAATKEKEEEQRFEDKKKREEFMEGESSTENLLSKMKGKTDGSESEGDMLAGEINECEKEIEDLKNKLKKASPVEAKGLEGKIAEAEKKKEKLSNKMKESYEKESNDLEGDINEFESKVEDLKNKLKEATPEEAKDLQGQIEELEKAQGKLRSKSKEVSKKKEEAKKKETSDAEKKLEDLKGKLKDASPKEAKELEGKIKELDKKLEDLTGKKSINESEDKKDSNKKENNKNQDKKLEDLKGSSKEDSPKEAKDLEGEVKELEKKKEKLRGKLKDATPAEAKDLEGQINDLEKKKEDLKGKIQKAKQKEAKEKEEKKKAEAKLKKDRLGGVLQKEKEQKEANTKKSSFKEKDIKAPMSGKVAEKESRDVEASISAALEDTKSKEDDSLEAITEEARIVVRIASNDDNTVFLCDLEELEEEILYVSYASMNMPSDHNYTITLTMDYGSKKVSIKTVGKISSQDEEVYCFDIKRIESRQLEMFRELYESKQQNILKFLKMAKGY